MRLRNYFEKKGIFLHKVGNRDFYTYWTRPKKSNDMKMNGYPNPDTAILIQGPILYEDDFTLETVRIYRKMFPESAIIVSTWSNEKKEVLQEIKDEGAIVCISELPDSNTARFCSINLQLINTKKGIEQAGKLGFAYCMKTRSDQRVYSKNAISFCKKMLESYPIGSDEHAMGRIITTSMGTFNKRLYNVSDLLLFGHTSDILQYYSCPEDTRNHKNEMSIQDYIEYSKRRTGEIWFSTHYLEALGHQLLWTKEDSDKVMRDYFIIIDAESIDLFWPKYTKREYRWRAYNDTEMVPLTYSDWLLMYVER